MYNSNKMNKRVVGLDEFRFGMSPHEEEILEGLTNEVEFFKSFGRDQEMKLSFNSSSRGSRLEKKTKVLWTKELHNKFLEAVGKLGIEKAVPKKIVELMNVDGLTRDHVASHLQKYRILSKKIANANYGVQNATKPSLLESSVTNGASWSHSSSLHNQEQKICPPILDTSSSYFPVLEVSNSNTMNKGNSVQAMTKNLGKQGSFVDYTTNLGVMNSVNCSNPGFVQNLDHAGSFHIYGGCSTEVQIYNNFDKASSGDMQYCSKSSFALNPNCFQSNYSSPNEFVEMGSSYGAELTSNFGNRTGGDDLVLSEVDIAHLLSFVDDNNQLVTLDPSCQNVNVQNSPNVGSFYLNHDQEHTSINQKQTLDAYLPGFEPTFDETGEQFLERVWSPDLLQVVQQFQA